MRMADSAAQAGTKRPRSSSLSEQQPHKRPRVQHSLHHVQRIPHHIEPAPQAPVFAQGQLLRSIRFALDKVGFDGVKASALEMFRCHAEEYMLRFGTHIRTAMQAQRRAEPTAQDFVVALARMEPENTRRASLLEPQLGAVIPANVSYPLIPDPDPPLAPIPDFLDLLPKLVPPRRSYIPQHFPPLPAKHSWMDTPVMAKKENDTRKMREIATQEGMLAEQALRRLAVAAKAGAMNAEKRRSSGLSGPGKVRQGGQTRLQDECNSFADVMKDLGGIGDQRDVGMDMDGLIEAEDVLENGMPQGVIVNYDMGHWRHGGSGKALRLQ